MSVVVLTPAASSALTTVERARTMLQFPDVSDFAAQMAIAQASAAAASYCRRTFAQETVRERFDLCREDATYGLNELMLDRWPVAEILSVMVDGALLSNTEYEADERTLYRLSNGARRCWSGRQLTVEYIAGWVLPKDGNGNEGNLPADIERAVIRLVGFAVSVSTRDPTVKSEDVTGLGSVSYYVQGGNASLPDPEAETLLRPYRRLLFA